MNLNREGAEAAKVVAELLSEVATADLLWSPLDGLPLYHCFSPGMVLYLGSL